MDAIKTILITGATGFLGSHLLHQLIDEGYTPVVYLRENSNLSRISHLKDRYKSFVATGYTNSNLAELFAQYEIDAVIHTATEYGRGLQLSEIIKTNVLFPLQLIEAGSVHQIKMFINTDTFFGKKHFELKYLNHYTTSKRILEGLLSGLASNNLSIINLRIEHVYGEHDGDQKFVKQIIDQALQNQPEIPLTNGLQKRDFIYVKDVVSAYITILKSASLIKGYNEFEVGTGQSITVKDFVSLIAKITATQSFFNFGAIPVREGEILDSFAQITKLQNLGWCSTYTLEEGLTATINSQKSLLYDNN